MMLTSGRISWCGCPDPVGGSRREAPGDDARGPGMQAQPGEATEPAPPPPPPVIVYQNTQTVTTTWSDWSTYHSKTRRYVQVDRYSRTMADSFTLWSDGSWFDTGWYQQSFTHSWQYWWALTLDPNRISARYNGGQRAGTGRTGQDWAAAGASGKCGLTGTLTSCLAEISTPPVGGGCADLRATVQACAPLAPVPGNPNAVREAGAGTAPQRAGLPFSGGA
ncbi:MAG TPA: hypothetical protein VL738_19125 [Dactylosporangium sp.]|jgi:hypothetical protein|nr:hypothetical protein [Dactylosporangium sp.]